VKLTTGEAIAWDRFAAAVICGARNSEPETLDHAARLADAMIVRRRRRVRASKAN
jgi:hypothetical protein